MRGGPAPQSIRATTSAAATFLPEFSGVPAQHHRLVAAVVHAAGIAPGDREQPAGWPPSAESSGFYWVLPPSDNPDAPPGEWIWWGHSPQLKGPPANTWAPKIKPLPPPEWYRSGSRTSAIVFIDIEGTVHLIVTSQPDWQKLPSTQEYVWDVVNVDADGKDVYGWRRVA